MTVKVPIHALAGMFAPALLALACATTPNASLRVGHCVIPGEGTLGISLAPIEVAPGETYQLPKPVVFTIPHRPPDTLPTGCLVRWSVDSGGAIDASGRLTIVREFVPGSTVEVRAEVGTLIARQDVYVVDPAFNPLAATWSQSTDPVCTNGAPPGDAIIRELVFLRGWKFSVTRMPFESFTDYWGSYSYDVATGRLRLTVEGGNVRPLFQSIEVVARVVGSELIIDGGTLHGTTAPPPIPPDPCRSVFKRVGAPR